MDIRLFAETRFYSKKVEKFVMEAKEKMRLDIDWDFYCDVNYTEDQWMLLNKFEDIARNAVEIEAPFVFQCPGSGDLLTGKVKDYSRKDKSIVIFYLEISDLSDFHITFSCTIHEKIILKNDNKIVIESKDRIFLPFGGIVTPSSLMICL